MQLTFNKLRHTGKAKEVACLADKDNIAHRLAPQPQPHQSPQKISMRHIARKLLRQGRYLKADNLTALAEYRNAPLGVLVTAIQGAAKPRAGKNLLLCRGQKFRAPAPGLKLIKTVFELSLLIWHRPTSYF
ncbi:hypothetical protein SDC9_148805 [bioreactor metagenome]|uniref:Uncharacterized protein n=1 Tax=bioreactor metagenome TaxID=1076179 RepID=A0A645EHW1_9ZZZZ